MENRVSVVYSIKHRDTGHEYVGMTSRKAQQRWAAHRSATKKGSELPVHRALRKHGYDAFDWCVLEVCDSFAEAQQAEVKLIAERAPAYNCSDGGEGLTNPSAEARQKMRDKALGRVRSPATRALMSAAKKKMWQEEGRRETCRAQRQGKPKSPEHVLKVTLAVRATNSAKRQGWL